MMVVMIIMTMMLMMTTRKIDGKEKDRLVGWLLATNFFTTDDDVLLLYDRFQFFSGSSQAIRFGNGGIL